MGILSFVKDIFRKPTSPPKQWIPLPIRYPLQSGLAPTQYLKIVQALPLAEIQPTKPWPRQDTPVLQPIGFQNMIFTNAAQVASIKEPQMNFILYINAVSSIIQAVEAAAGAYTAQSGQAIPGADKMKSVVALVGSAGGAFAAFLPGLESLVGTLVQSYNDSGLFHKKAAA